VAFFTRVRDPKVRQSPHLGGRKWQRMEIATKRWKLSQTNEERGGGHPLNARGKVFLNPERKDPYIRSERACLVNLWERVAR